MPTYEYRCDECRAVTAVQTPMSRRAESQACERCGSASTRRIVSLPAVRRSNLSKAERFDPRYDKMVDQAMRNTRHAEPDRLINRRGDIAAGLPDKR